MNIAQQVPDAGERPLPALREELQVMPGAALMGGAPSWMIYDPVQAKFFQISIEVFQMLSHWSAGTVAKLRDGYTQSFGRAVEEEDVLDAVKFLTVNSLTRDSASGSYRDFAERAGKARTTGLKFLAKNYLFFRIPVAKPARFLERTLPTVEKLFFNRFAAIFILAISLCGLMLASRQWDVFLGQFSHLFNVTGIAVYFVALAFIKIMHELGHAYTATRFGVRVHTMGVAFLVMMPVLYTDTTDAWRLKSSKQRAWIDAAGMIVELAIAGLATFLWLFLDDGPVRSAVFALATTAWVLSLLINLNPFMRFDGYYLLADSLSAPNLQPRSFALSKWRLREFLFGINDAAPEPKHKMRTPMIVYGYCVWVYRFFLFLGIGLLVYTLFFKVLGVALFALEIVWFICKPVYAEMKVWYQKKEDIVATRRSKFSLATLCAMLLLMFIPWSTTVEVPAVLAAKDVKSIYSKHDAIVESVAVKTGDSVQQGDTLLQLRSPALEFELSAAEQELALVKSRQNRRTVDAIDRSESIILSQQYDMAQVRLRGVEEKLQQLKVAADFSGTISDVDRELHEGQWVSAKRPLGTLVDHSLQLVRGYVSETVLPRVKSGESGVFVPNDIAVASVDVQLMSIAQADNAAIDIEYLASVYGGDIAVELDEDAYVPLESAYYAEFEVLGEQGPRTQAIAGIVRLDAESESLAKRIWRSVAKVAVRELGV